MQLVAGDLLADACKLSPGLALAPFGAGLLLWLGGWWSHRFWVVLTATVLAGIYGLMQAPSLQAPTLPTAVLMALSAGVLALALVRVVAFAAAGVLVVLLVQEFVPGLNQPLLVFLSSGLVCLLLFRLCLTALTATAGATLLTYATLMMLGHYAGQDVVAWVDKAPGLFNWVGGVLAFSGFAVQLYVHRRAQRRSEEDEDEDEERPRRLLRVWQWVNGDERDAA